MKFRYIYFLFILIFGSCETERKNKSLSPRIKSISTVISPSNSEIFVKGDSIQIEVKTDNKIINSILILENDTINFKDSYKISSNTFNKYGKNQIKIIRQLSNDKTEIDIKNIYIYPKEIWKIKRNENKLTMKF